MKLKILFLFAVLLLRIAPVPLFATPQEDARLELINVNNQPIVAVDILKASRNEKVKAAAWYAKPFVGLREILAATGSYAFSSPGNFLKTAGTGYLGIRAAQGKLDDDAKSLLKTLNLRDEDESPAPPSSANPDGSANPSGTTQDGGINLNVTGDGNEIVLTTGGAE